MRLMAAAGPGTLFDVESWSNPSTPEVDFQDVDVIYETGLTTSNVDDVNKKLASQYAVGGGGLQRLVQTRPAFCSAVAWRWLPCFLPGLRDIQGFPSAKTGRRCRPYFKIQRKGPWPFRESTLASWFEIEVTIKGK